MATVLDISNLRFSWPGSAGPPVLSGVSLRLEAGEHVLLRGGSGSGKSTLLSVIAGLLSPQGGSVEVGGQNIFALPQGRRDAFRGTHIGMIFQTFQLLSGFSAAENVMAALMFTDVPPAEHRQRADRLLRELGIERPDADVGTLSVGQQQRVAVARAVACRPVLVLADEPTASLDPANAAAAVEVIRAACRGSGATLLVTSHDPALEGRFDRQIGIDRGQIITGEPAAAISAKGVTHGTL